MTRKTRVAISLRTKLSRSTSIVFAAIGGVVVVVQFASASKAMTQQTIAAARTRDVTSAAGPAVASTAARAGGSGR
jgi:hypothetical protein